MPANRIANDSRAYSEIFAKGLLNVQRYGFLTITSRASPWVFDGTVTGSLNGSSFSSGAVVTNLTCAIAGSSGSCSVMFGPGSFSVAGHDHANCPPRITGSSPRGLRVPAFARQRVGERGRPIGVRRERHAYQRAGSHPGGAGRSG